MHGIVGEGGQGGARGEEDDATVERGIRCQSKYGAKGRRPAASRDRGLTYTRCRCINCLFARQIEELREIVNEHTSTYELYAFPSLG